jgi:hypothetical protein
MLQPKTTVIDLNSLLSCGDILLLIAHNFIDFALEKIPLSPAQITLPYIKPPTFTKKPLQTESLLYTKIISYLLV